MDEGDHILKHQNIEAACVHRETDYKKNGISTQWKFYLLKDRNPVIFISMDEHT